MKQQVTPLTDQDVTALEEMRRGLRGLLKPEVQAAYDTVDGKLAIINAVLRESKFDLSNVWLLQALGLCFGDALSQQLGMTWAIVTDAQGRTPALILPGKRLRLTLFAFTTIQKRVEGNEECEAISLFNVFCHVVQKRSQPKQSFFARIFGSRLT